MRRLTALALTTVSACSIGPHYVRPTVPVSPQFAQFDSSTFTASPPTEFFWTDLGDPVLTELLETALTANTDLRVSVARIDRASALTRLARWDFLPHADAQAGYAKTRLSAVQAPGVPRTERDASYFEYNLASSWELDLFGRVRRGVEAARSDREAALADLRALRVTIAAEVALAYFELRDAQEELRVAHENEQNQRATLELTEARLAAGRGTEFDTDRARGQLEATIARTPVLETTIAVTVHRIAVLDGRSPGELLRRLTEPGPSPALPPTVAVGDPAELLRRRPDVAAAERRLAASTARIGVAASDLFPHLTLTGAFGGAANRWNDLTTRDAESYIFLPAIDWSFLDIGRTRERIVAARADAAADLAFYQGSVLRAYEEAEDALVSYARARAALEHLSAAAAADHAAAELARVRFRGGTADFLQVLDAERTQLESQDAAVLAHLRAASALVGLYRALGGGTSPPAHAAQP